MPTIGLVTARSPLPLRSTTLDDGRQSARASDIARGAARLLAQHDLRCITEVTLANGRRADLLAVGPKGEIWIIEVKSSFEDFRTDSKWPAYREFCDRLYFAVAADFPEDVLPEDVGLMICDRYGGEMLREAPDHALATARRKALLLRFARVAAGRLMTIKDPEQALEPLPRD
ncbi:MAG: MmcB family DNA repair protein [Hyphomicrobiaceae bacterium]